MYVYKHKDTRTYTASRHDTLQDSVRLTAIRSHIAAEIEINVYIEK